MSLRALALASLLSTPAWAQEVTTARLDNGMEVVVIEDHRAPVAVHMIWYKTGSADEPAGSSGVAHFLEHLLFKATDERKAGEIDRLVAETGGSHNAFTDVDFTAYHQRVVADRLPLMMAMEADRMNDLRLTEADIEAERGVILEERAGSVDADPQAIAFEQMQAALFLNHRYGQPVIGWRHEMAALDMADVLGFYDLYYSPNNAIVVVAGDVEPDAVIAMAEEHYGPLPAEPRLPSRARAQEPPQLAERRVVYKDERVAEPYLARSYLAPPRDAGDQEEAAALVYLSWILGGSPYTSVLAKALTFEADVALDSWADYLGTSLDHGVFTLGVLPSDGVTLQEAEEAMDAAVAAFLEDGVDAAQMERARTQIEASEIYARDDVEGLANRYGEALATGLSVEDEQAWPAILQAVTAEDVMAAAQAVLDRDRSVTLWVDSDGEAPR